METLFAGGRIVDLLLLLVAAEGLWLAWRRRNGRSGPDSVWPFLAAGAGLLVAMRLALSGAWWGWIGLALAASGAAHALDLRARWKGSRRRSGEDVLG